MSDQPAQTGPPALPHALRSHWPLVALPVVVLAVLAIIAGLARSPTYTTQAELNVGQTDIATQALPGFVDGAVSLADSYSRVVQSQQVIDPVARRLRLPNKQVRSKLSAVPVPDRTVFRIKATGDTPEQAERIARAGVQEIQGYVSRLGSSESQSSQLLRSYRDAAARAQTLASRVNRLEARDAPDRAIENARVDESTARLRVQALGQQYQDARPTATGATIQVLDAPDSAVSDRGSVLQQYLAVAIIIGLLVGVALAVTASSRAWRRNLQAV